MVFPGRSGPLLHVDTAEGVLTLAISSTAETNSTVRVHHASKLTQGAPVVLSVTIASAAVVSADVLAGLVRILVQREVPGVETTALDPTSIGNHLSCHTGIVVTATRSCPYLTLGITPADMLTESLKQNTQNMIIFQSFSHMF